MNRGLLGRNAYCPCGSGKKYKHCCLRAGESEFARAVQWYGQGKMLLGLEVARNGLAKNPRDPRLYVVAGLCLLALGDVMAAEQHFRQALLCDGNDADACSNLGVLVARKGRIEEAERLYRRALEACPDSHMALLNLGDLLATRGLMAEAEALFARAIEVAPALGAAHYAMGHLQASLGRWPAAEASYRMAIGLNPGDILARYNLACLLLACGKFEEGWQVHEVRMSSTMPERKTVAPPLSVPFWAGEKLQGKRLLVWPEQGFGDEIQFLRYLAQPALRDCAQLTLVCKPELKNLFASLGLAAAVFALGDPAVFERQFDFWTFSMSLPLRCKTRLESIPADIPYITAASEKIHFWGTRLPVAPYRVGLAWKGSPMHRNDANRSLGALTTLAPLWRVGGVSFVSLQKGQGEDEARNAPAHQPLFHYGELIEDFSDSAAILHHLDLIICVDTAIAHLAGAMGKRCWVLLPATDTDWRWLHDRQDSPWYPGRTRLFRQSHGGAWKDVVEDVRKELARLVGYQPA